MFSVWLLLYFGCVSCVFLFFVVVFVCCDGVVFVVLCFVFCVLYASTSTTSNPIVQVRTSIFREGCRLKCKINYIQYIK